MDIDLTVSKPLLIDRSLKTRTLSILSVFYLYYSPISTLQKTTDYLGVHRNAHN